MKKSLIVFGIVCLVLVLDQALKIWIKTHFYYGEDRPLFGNATWARLNFVENSGMAFGWQFGGNYGKLALSLFRLVAIGFLIYYIPKFIRRGAGIGLLTGFALILAGAIGNMLDSAFYGLIFSASDYTHFAPLATLFPAEGGYGTFLQGKVVDMLFFPMWKNANGEVVFSQHVFNLADAAITIGVITILAFQRQFAFASKKQIIAVNH